MLVKYLGKYLFNLKYSKANITTIKLSYLLFIRAARCK